MFRYVATHASVEDDSTAMIVLQDDKTITLMNEDGYTWRDPLNQWVPI